MVNNAYVIDTSSLVALKPFFEYKDTLVSLWSEINSLIKSKRLVSPKAVYDEIKDSRRTDKKDELLEWVVKHDQNLLPFL